MKFSKAGLTLAGVYLALIVASDAYIFYRINFKPANSEFCGMPLILLTLPWSGMVQGLKEMIHLPLKPVWINTLVLTLSGLPTLLILYFIGARFEKGSGKK